MAHHRLFVALRPPRPVRAALAAAMGGVAHARWQDDDQLHCTLRFIGEVDRHGATDVAAVLSSLRHPPVEAALGGFGTFDSRGRVTTLYVEIAPISALSGLHAKVERLLVGAGIAPDRRAWRPHVTLARFSRGDAPPRDVALRLAPPPSLAMRFDAVVLYESRLARDGATYEVVGRYPLRPTTAV